MVRPVDLVIERHEHPYVRGLRADAVVASGCSGFHFNCYRALAGDTKVPAVDSSVCDVSTKQSGHVDFDESAVKHVPGLDHAEHVSQVERLVLAQSGEIELRQFARDKVPVKPPHDLNCAPATASRAITCRNREQTTTLGQRRRRGGAANPGISVIHLLHTGNVCLIRVMPAERDLGGELLARFDHGTLDIVFPGGVSAIRFTRADHLAQIALRFGTGRLGVDVSFQPGVVGREIDQTAREHGIDPNRWRLATLAMLREWSGSLDWCPQLPGRLVAAVSALAHPLLQPVYERAHEATNELPRWSLTVLRSPDPAAAARTIDPAANRRLARALAQSLVARPAPAPVELGPLAFAVMGAGLVTVDELANVLEARLPERPVMMPSAEEIREVRRGLEQWPAQRRAALLLDTATYGDPVALATAMRQFWWVRDKADRPLPVRFAELQAMCGRLVPVLAPSAERPRQRSTAPELALELTEAVAVARRRPPQPARASAAASAPVARRAEPVAAQSAVATAVRAPHEQPRGAPRVPLNPHALGVVRWPVPRALLAISDHSQGGLRFVVPTSRDEMRRWGRVLHNCVGDFGNAMAAGHSWVIGIEKDDHIIGCIEVNPTNRQVRQALGPRNRPLPASVATTMFEALQRCNVTVN